MVLPPVFHQGSLSRHPDIAFPVLRRGKSVVQANWNGMCSVTHREALTRGGIEKTESLKSRSQQNFPVGQIPQLGNLVRRDAVTIPGNVVVSDEMITVVFLEAVFGSDPNKSVPILEDVLGRVIGEPFGNAEVLQYEEGLGASAGWTNQGQEAGQSYLEEAVHGEGKQ